MDQVGLDQEIQRPIDCRWRHFAASTIQAIKDIVRTNRLVTVPDQLQYPPALFREAKPALTADFYGRRYSLCHAVLVIVFFTRGRVYWNTSRPFPWLLSMTAQIVQRFSIRNSVWNQAHFLYNLRRQLVRSDSQTKMPVIQLPDGSERQFDDAVTGAEIASDISKSLARDAVAIRVGGELWDLGRRIEDDVAIEIVTRDSEDGLELLRHDAAHILAEAVKELWPDTQVTIGPAIENGFYYDFAREEPFTEEDLEVITKRMLEIVERDEEIIREVWARDDAIKFFRDLGRGIQSADHRRYSCG